MVKTNRELRKTLDVRLCYVLFKRGVHSDQYKVGDKVFNIPMPLIKKVWNFAEEVGEETVADNAGDAFTTGILSGTGIMEYEDERID